MSSVSVFRLVASTLDSGLHRDQSKHRAFASAPANCGIPAPAGMTLSIASGLDLSASLALCVPGYCSISSVQSLSHVRLFATPRTAARQASPPCPSPTPEPAVYDAGNTWRQRMAPAASSEALHLSRQVRRCWRSTSRDRDGLKPAWPREGWVLIIMVMLLCLDGSLEGSQGVASSGLSSVVLHLPLVRSAAEPLGHLFWNWQECGPSVSSMGFCPVILPSLASSQMDSGLDLKILGSAFLAGELV